MKLKNAVFCQLYRETELDHSGEALSRSLGVSRAAVWKAVRSLVDEGCEISSVTNRGYRLLSTGDFCDGEALSAVIGVPVFSFPSLPSTNAYALSLDEPLPFLAVADEQTKGKSVHRGEFPSPENRGVYASYAFLPKAPKTTPYENYTAIAVAQAIGGSATGHEIFFQGKKVGGVLVEERFDPDGLERVVVGFGVYLNGLSVPRFTLLERVLNELKKL